MSKRISIKSAVRVASTALITMSMSLAMAQSFPNKPVKIVVPYPPGGTTDIVGRLIAQQLQTRMGQAFIVENKPGAGGNLGADSVAKSSPDGYTLLLVASNVLAINPALYKKMPFDAATAFAPVSNIATLPNVVIVNPENKYHIKSLTDLMSTAKTQPPGTLNYGSTGNGALTHLLGSVLVKASGTTMMHVPYKGSAPMLQGLYGNEIDFAIDNLPSAVAHITSGRLHALAVTSAQRNPVLPSVPTTTELGYPALNLTSWFGLVAPAKTDPKIVSALNTQIAAALADKSVIDQLAQFGAQPAPGRPEDFGALIKSEAARWAPIVRESGASID